jgi:hypothetical protein
MSLLNNLDFDATPSQFIYDQYGQPIEVRYVGNHTDPQTQLSYFVYATNERTPILVPQPLAPHQLAPPQPYPDDYPADPMGSPRPQSPRPQRQRTSRQESARQRKNTRRTQRREEVRRFRENQAQIMFANPANIFNPRLPPAPMKQPVSPVHQQAPDPNSRRSRRKASSQQRAERAARIASGRIVGGAKTKRRHRRY